MTVLVGIIIKVLIVNVVPADKIIVKRTTVLQTPVKYYKVIVKIL
ncbi:6188_t:CDS:2 [Entrophospora sp. SA101]|nr:6188_t:CDS:2 [Entrophospora sp. SA101]